MSIIGISGKKTVGKNTIAKIINQLTNNKYEEKCFADKLKDIVCLLIGCNREQLENESFKSKELGEEWWYWYMERDGGYSPIILDYLTTTKKQLKNYEGLELIKPTPRFLLQFIGTNLFRNQLHPEIWINSLMSEYKLYKETKPFVNSSLKDEEYPNWVITDTRFPNELKAVKDRGGITVRVDRPRIVGIRHTLKDGTYKDEIIKEHESETSLDDATFDYYINNNGSLEELIEEVVKIYQDVKKNKLL